MKRLGSPQSATRRLATTVRIYCCTYVCILLLVFFFVLFFFASNVWDADCSYRCWWCLFFVCCRLACLNIDWVFWLIDCYFSELTVASCMVQGLMSLVMKPVDESDLSPVDTSISAVATLLPSHHWLLIRLPLLPLFDYIKMNICSDLRHVSTLNSIPCTRCWADNLIIVAVFATVFPVNFHQQWVVKLCFISGCIFGKIILKNIFYFEFFSTVIIQSFFHTSKLVFCPLQMLGDTGSC